MLSAGDRERVRSHRGSSRVSLCLDLDRASWDASRDNYSINLDGFRDSRPDLVVVTASPSVSSCLEAVLSWGCALPNRPVHLVRGRVSGAYLAQLELIPSDGYKICSLA